MYLLACLLLLLSWLLPMHLLPWTSWHKEVLAFAAAALVFGEALRLRWSHRQMELPRLTTWFLMLGMLVMVRGLVGSTTYQGDAIVIECYLLIAVMLIAAGYAQEDPIQSAACLAYVLLLAGLISTVVALVQVLDVWDLESWIIRMRSTRRAGANLGQPNHLGTLLLFALASLGYLRANNRASGLLMAWASAFLLTGVVLTESRTAIVGLLLLSAWWMLRGKPTGRERLFTAVGLCYFAALSWLWPDLHQAIQLDGDGVARITGDAGGRLTAWRQLWDAVMLKPWWGWGLRNVSEAHNAVLAAYTTAEPFTYAHNVVLDLAVGVGLPWAALFVVAAVVWVWRRLRDSHDPVSWYVLAIVMVLGAHSMLEYPFAYAYLLFPVVFMTGVLEGRHAQGSVFRVPRAAALTVFLATCVVLLWSAWEYVQIEEDLRVARFEALKIGQTPSDYERPKISVLKQLDTMLYASRIVPAPEMTEQQLELARQAAVRFPWTAIQNRYALSLALNGHTDEAIRQLKVMRAMHGEKNYQGIRANWKTLAEEKYPELNRLQLP